MQIFYLKDSAVLSPALSATAIELVIIKDIIDATVFTNKVDHGSMYILVADPLCTFMNDLPADEEHLQSCNENAF